MNKEHTIQQEYDACRIQRLKLEAVFNSVSDGIIALDEDLQVTNVNRSALQTIGFSNVGIVSKSLLDIFCLKNNDARRKLVSSLHARELISELETEIVTKNGEPRRVVVNTTMLDDDSEQFAGFVIVFRDISELYRLKEEVKGKYRFGNIIGKNNKMQEVYELILQTALSQATVLLEGESGTGKQLVAQAIHYNSPRMDKPFATVNCSALPETLLETELFGHVKGAFTGAVAEKIGRFEAADGGTIFLDEIGDVSPFIQLKLLRVLDTKEFEKVGSNKTQKLDVRIISATNKNLKQEMQKGNFREDLYYRLRVVPITLPPLRERKDDIPLLVNRFVEEFAQKTKKPIDGITPSALNALLDYDWPGNVRELRNAIEFAFVHCQGRKIRTEDLPNEVRSLKGTASLRATYSLHKQQTDEKSLILQAFKEAKGNKSKAAKLLGIGRTSLWKKIKQYGVE